MTRSRTHIGSVLLLLILLGCGRDDSPDDDVTLQGRFTSVDGMTDIASSPVLAFDSAGSPHIAYRDVISNELRYATQSHDGNWQIESIDMTDGFSISLALSPANIP